MIRPSRQVWVGCTSGNIGQTKLGIYCKINSLCTFQDQQKQMVILRLHTILDCTFHALMDEVRQDESHPESPEK